MTDELRLARYSETKKKIDNIMKYNKRYFKHVEDCKCDIDKIKETMEAAVSRRAPWEVDKGGNPLFYCDSFGYRGKIPGETEECYMSMSDARSKASKIPEGCTCIWANVLDEYSYDCPHHKHLAEEMYGPEVRI
jgi:hypothetical protein